MKFSTLLFIAVYSAGIAAAGPAVAFTPSPDQPFTAPSDDASYSQNRDDDETQEKTAPIINGSVQYMSGGVSDEGMSTIEAEANNYNFKMLFVSGKEYLANVNVTIADAKGDSLLNATTNGPVLLVKMPPGRYTVTAQTEGEAAMKHQIKVGRDHLTSYVMRFPPENEDQGENGSY